ncbi:TPA: SycD/LcrH family type III secretion system chaperone [Salmonella enterica subsp. enterica serovar Bredeney]|uniref:CesD/SycD/LcrH family type III secretion system chaperone n=3 Tax=Salmonella enterica TaxID=28901 RepID=A0A5I3EQD1_SALET|nr:SycD/LcrH family type III secretion system chaperone [Salmonella enterica]EAA2100258.1 CesD/SycD/LcrH family type III secretion system chaperone [Salmonella enterica subsp. enterica serovar Bredeney]EAA7354151.1 CesD/SycD/LcrH family type III secretion system chaperone [Salmonella enterica subsp. enterica]EAB7892622.1 CesD/SycD/LcrH family type III secretion system chaperone [Salmonella enterica subsp. enterica serovar Newport]EBW5413661.1 CesD/SycD/LcrH family type III secretion system chap
MINDDNAGLSGVDVDELIKAIHGGATLKTLNGISDEVMDELHNMAYAFYQNEKLDEAIALYRFLYIYDFYNAEYAMGIGAILQLKKQYDKAIDFYALAYALSRHDYRPMFYAGECNLMLGKLIQAKECFKIVKEESDEKSLTDKAEIYLNVINERCGDFKSDEEMKNVHGNE